MMLENFSWRQNTRLGWRYAWQANKPTMTMRLVEKLTPQGQPTGATAMKPTASRFHVVRNLTPVEHYKADGGAGQKRYANCGILAEIGRRNVLRLRPKRRGDMRLLLTSLRRRGSRFNRLKSGATIRPISRHPFAISRSHRMTEAEKPDLTSLTVQLLSAYVSNNTLPSNELAELIRTTRGALEGGVPANPAGPDFAPAVSVRKSLGSRDHIVSMIDGKRYKSLKRHLSSHGLTPSEYRTRYNLPSDYPMVAPGYSEQRREVAQRLGLGRKKAESPSAPDTQAAAMPANSSEPASTIAQVLPRPSLTSAVAAPSPAPSPLTKGTKRAAPKAKVAATSAPSRQKASPQGTPGERSPSAKREGETDAASAVATNADAREEQAASRTGATPAKAPAGRKKAAASAAPDAAAAPSDQPAQAVSRARTKAKTTSVTANAKKATAPRRSAKAASAAPEGETAGADGPLTEATA